VDTLKSVTRSLNICNEDPTTEDAIDTVDDVVSKEESDTPVVKSCQWRSRTVKLTHQPRSLPIMKSIPNDTEFISNSDAKVRSHSFDSASKLHQSRYQPNPFRFPPPSNRPTLYSRRRTASDVVNHFTFNHTGRSINTDKGANDNVSPWNQDDAGAWDGYISGIIPEEQEPQMEQQESPRRFSDPGGVPLTPRNWNTRQVSDPGVVCFGAGNGNSVSTPTIVEED
jgi:hypothetical protein